MPAIAQNNVMKVLTVASVVLHSMEIQAELWRREPNAWQHLMLAPDAAVTLESIGFSAPLAAFYRSPNLGKSIKF